MTYLFNTTLLLNERSYITYLSRIAKMRMYYSIFNLYTVGTTHHWGETGIVWNMALIWTMQFSRKHRCQTLTSKDQTQLVYIVGHVTS